MSNSKEHIKNIVKELLKDGKLPTPQEYQKLFCKELKTAGYSYDECNLVEKYIHKLDKKHQDRLRISNISTVEEFLTYLIGELNRQPDFEKPTKILLSQEQLIKRLLQVITKLHNKEAKDLAQKQFNSIDFNSLDELLAVRTSWKNFATNYDDSFFNELSKFVAVDKNSIKETILKVIELLKPTNVLEEFDYSSLSVDFLTKTFTQESIFKLLKLKESEYLKYKNSYFLVLFDIDNLADLNSEYGYDSGDVILKTIGALLKKEVKAVGRVYEDSFLIITTDVSFAEKFILHIEHSKFLYKGEQIKTTLSGAIVNRNDFESLDDMIEKTKELVSKAKSDGKNRICYI